MRSNLSSLALASVALAACSGDDDAANNGSTNNGAPMCQDISGSVDVGGLMIRRAPAEATGCRAVDGASEEEQVCEQVTPDLSCLGQTEPLGTSYRVTFTGCVSSFGLEAQSDDLTVTVLEEAVNGAPTDPGYELTGPAGAQDEKTPAARVDSVRSVTVPRETCFDLGQFSVDGVPTETRLIVRVTDQHVETDRRQYVDTYQYNVVLRNDQIREGPSPDAPFVSDPETYCAQNACYVVDDVNTVFETTFKTIALTAGVSRITGDDDLYDGTGQGHVAGEVQDCTSENTIRNAVVALDSDVRKLAYFNVGYPPAVGNIEDPKVDQSRSRTNADGLYAAIAVDAQDGGQPVNIGAIATRSLCGDDGVCRCQGSAENPLWTGPDANEAKVDVLGSRTIYVYPDSITILTFDRSLYTVE